MTFKVGQQVKFSERGIDHFCSSIPGGWAFRSHLIKDEGEITAIEGDYIHVKWTILDDTYKAESWAIEPKRMN